MINGSAGVSATGDATPAKPVALTSLEIACGLVFGLDPDAEPLPRDADQPPPLAALQHAMLPALQRPPCVVSFSGGRDSSGVLAAATAAARTHGLPAPIPVSLRFPDAQTHEPHWQETVVRHLGLHEWERIELVDELDMLGPYATHVLRRHGVVWPFNAHFHLPVFERAAGGSALTGVGGDELLQPGRWRRVGMLSSGRAVPRFSDIGDLMLAISPHAIRRSAIMRSGEVAIPMQWLHDDVERAVHLALADDAARMNVGFNSSLRDSWWRSRFRRVGTATLEVLAADHDVTVITPLHDPQFLGALAAHAGRGGFWSRSAAMHSLFGSLLPRATVERSTKARFDAAFFHRRSSQFVSVWDGSGLDHQLVDVDALQRIWLTEGQNAPLTWLLLQQAWVATQGVSTP